MWNSCYPDKNTLYVVSNSENKTMLFYGHEIINNYTVLYRELYKKMNKILCELINYKLNDKNIKNNLKFNVYSKRTFKI